MRHKLTLNKTHPEIAKQWHPTKNGELIPSKITAGSAEKVWWKCDVADDHDWEATPVSRTSMKTGCLCCRGYKVVKSNCLATTHPKIASQWHPYKNGNLTPFDVTSGNHKKVWWKCPKGGDHEWSAIISNRTRLSGCPICCNQKVVLSNCLATTHPNMIKEWHPTKNGSSTPYDFTAGSSRSVWWKCEAADDHEWKAIIANRVLRRDGCPYCAGKKVSASNCLSMTHPELAKQWHPTKNGKMTPSDVTAGSMKKVWWKCNVADDHEWIAMPNSRTSMKSGCPCCANVKVVPSNCLNTTHPKLSKEWHPTKNGNLTPIDVTAGSAKKVWWKCNVADDHDWKATIVKRAHYGRGCPCCDGKKVVLSNCLATTNSELAKEWHTTKNGDLTPYDVIAGSMKKVWWKCNVADDHEWNTRCVERLKGRGCPCCSGTKVVKSNCFATTHPKAAKLWHPYKNKNITPFQITANSHTSNWWKCNVADDHEWRSTANRVVQNQKRSTKSSCPMCSGLRVVKSNCLATMYPEVAKEWYLSKNKPLTPEKVLGGTDRRVWWVCKKDKSHVWITSIWNRLPPNASSCPYCTLTPQSKQELTILFELKSIFPDINPLGYKILIGRSIVSMDIFLERFSLAIEYDGAYWHKDKSKFDEEKTNTLKKTGYEVIRLRQRPLNKIFEMDIIIERKFNAKLITNAILLRIIKNFSLSDGEIIRIERYLSKNSIENEDALNDYVEQILVEKSKKSK